MAELNRDIRAAVREKYAAAAGRPASCGCGPGFGAANYDAEAVPAAALEASLGCGVPTAVAELHPGETVLDLGSGAGADVLISARRVGPNGRVIGLDMTDEMLAVARANAVGVSNVEFVKGYIEQIPLPDSAVDVVISNCVINLSADKHRVLAEAARVLRSGGRLAVSDVIADPDMDAATRADVDAYTGCVAGALTEAEFRRALAEAGMTDVEIRPTHRVHEHAAAALVRARKPAIRLAVGDDLAAIAAIFEAGRRGATFGAADAPADVEGTLVADEGGRVTGFARVVPSGDRCAQAGVGEYAIYLEGAARGRGLGGALLRALVASAHDAGYWKLVGRMFTTNTASIALARSCGFREVGVHERHGRVDGEWKDLMLVERLIG